MYGGVGIHGRQELKRSTDGLGVMLGICRPKVCEWKRLLLNGTQVRILLHESLHAFGDLAQLVEHQFCILKVRGSIPLVSTMLSEVT